MMRGCGGQRPLGKDTECVPLGMCPLSCLPSCFWTETCGSDGPPGGRLCCTRGNEKRLLHAGEKEVPERSREPETRSAPGPGRKGAQVPGVRDTESLQPEFRREFKGRRSL